MKISIALATFNGARYLENQLNSYLTQTRPPDELVVSDDNSWDQTWDILEEFKSRSPFPVRILRNDGPRGIFWNFRSAVLQCQGEIIVLSDQDDIWFSTKLATIENYFSEHPQLLALATNSVQIDGDGSPRHVDTWQDVCRFSERRLRRWGDNPVRIFLAFRGICAAHGLAVSRELATMCGEPSNLQHYAVVFRAFDSLLFATAAVLRRSHWLYQPLTAYRRHGTNTSTFEKQSNVEIAKLDAGDRYLNRVRQVELAMQHLDEKGIEIDSSYRRRITEMLAHYKRATVVRNGGLRGIGMLLYLICSGSYARNAKPSRNLIGDVLCCISNTVNRLK